MSYMKTKKILWLIVIAIIISFIALACKKRPTNAANLSVIEEAGQTPSPEKKLTIDSSKGLSQFEGLSFKSGVYKRKNGDYSKSIYFYADVKVDSKSKPYISIISKDEEENIVEDQGEFYSISNETGAVYNLTGAKYGGKITAEVTFTEDGYLHIKFNHYSSVIICSLIGKTETEVEEKKFGIDFSKDLSQFEGFSFKSGGYIRDGGYVYYYADVKVDSQSKPYISMIKKDSAGNIVEDQGEFYPISNETGAVYNLKGVKNNGKITAKVTFIAIEESYDGYLNIKFNNYSDSIVYSLIK